MEWNRRVAPTASSRLTPLAAPSNVPVAPASRCAALANQRLGDCRMARRRAKRGTIGPFGFAV